MISPSRVFRHFLAGVVFLVCTQCVLAATPVRVGVLAWQGQGEAEAQWSALMRRLEAQLQGKAIALRYFDLAGIAAALKAGELDFVVTNPGHYVTLEADSGISRIATQVFEASADPAHVVGSAVVVLDRRRELQGLADLRGKTLAAVSPDAFGGYQLIWAELRRLGLDPERGQPSPRFMGFPMSRVVDAVLNGEADAGVVRACLLEHLVQSGALEPGHLRVLSPQSGEAACRVSSRLYPGWAFAAAGGTPQALSREVLLALLSLSPDESGQSWGVPADYRPVHELLRELQIGPYAFMRESGWSGLLRRYWPWALGLVLTLLVWGGYTLHVEHLVQRRTCELTRALAERRELGERVRAGQEQMDHLSRLSILGELSGTLAHELNQPLAAIGNYARGLLRRQDSGNLSPEALRRAAAEIASESERAAAILGGIRAFARKRSQTREVRDAAELVEQASRLMAGLLARAPVVSVEHKLPAADRSVLIDQLQVQQVLLNLFKNAWDAQQTAGSDVPIEVRLEREGGRCLVSVRDHGPGLPRELRSRLFEPFFTTKPDGLGLGLSICKTIVEAHGGELMAGAAESGPGLVFRFSLPLAVSAPGENHP